MRKLTVPVLLAVLILGCGGDGNGDGDVVTGEDGELVYKTEESLVDAFIEAANSKDEEVFFSLFFEDSSANAVWERITESALTFSPGYHIEEGPFGKHVIFDSARWEGYGVYEQQLYISDDPALGVGWTINGQDYAFVTEEDTGDEIEEETVEDAGDVVEEEAEEDAGDEVEEETEETE